MMKPQLNVSAFLETFTELMNSGLYYYIYRLLDPRTGQVCYVGRTFRPTCRLQEHLLEAEKSVHKTFKHQWFCELKELGFEPRIEFIEICEVHQAEEREQYWIDFYRGNNGSLFNTNTSRPPLQRYRRIQEPKGSRWSYRKPLAYTAKQAHEHVFQNITTD